MKLKKTNRANLEKKRGLFFQFGLIFSLLITLLAFQWKTPLSGDVSIDSDPFKNFTETSMINTYMEPDIPEPPKPEVFELNIVDNSNDFTSQLLYIRPEIDENEKINYEPVKAKEEKIIDDIPFRKVEEMPKFMDGDLMTFIKYVQTHVIYSEEAKSMKIKGRVTADFVVNKEGYVQDVKILKGVDPLLDNEVVRVLKHSPRWKPGKQRNIPVKVAFSIPIVFELEN